uniref:Transcription elongation factor SPT5 n=1 Tax=Lygus hesperus TaxID=30085 RepID=A0A0A9XJQ5_LYGHE
MTAEELGHEYEERLRQLRAPRLKLQKPNTTYPYGAGSSSNTIEGQQVVSSLRYAAHLLPQESDPKVFAVKCRPRMARVLVARIVNKCYAYRVGRNFEHRCVDLGIISVFSLDHVK